jgi:hypothetical protein
MPRSKDPTIQIDKDTIDKLIFCFNHVKSGDGNNTSPFVPKMSYTEYMGNLLKGLQDRHFEKHALHFQNFVD